MTNDNETILPEEPNAAVEKMIELAEECQNVLQAESDRMTINDMIKFTVSAADKERIFGFYEQAVMEFKNRMDELRGNVDPAVAKRQTASQVAIPIVLVPRSSASRTPPSGKASANSEASSVISALPPMPIRGAPRPPASSPRTGECHKRGNCCPAEHLGPAEAGCL